MNTNPASETTTATKAVGGPRKRVRFEDAPVYHEPDNQELESGAIWYTPDELSKMFQDDIRDTRNFILAQYAATRGKKITISREPGRVDPTAGDAATVATTTCKYDDLSCIRGMEMLSSEETTRLSRCALYRALVVKQYNILHGLLDDEEADKRLQAFACKNSQWAVDRAIALASQDAADARKIYHDVARESAIKGEPLVGVVPSARKRFFGRGLRRPRNANRVASA